MHNLKRNLSLEDEHVGAVLPTEDGEQSPISSQTNESQAETEESAIWESSEKRRRIDSLDALIPLLLDDTCQFNFDYKLFAPMDPPDMIDSSTFSQELDICLTGSPIITCVDLDKSECDMSMNLDEESIINELSLLVEAVEREGEQKLQLQELTNVSPSRVKLNFEVTLPKIPSWSVYYADQKDNMIPKYSEIGKCFQANDTINSKISCWFGDITNLNIDVIVNSTTYNYSGEDGVDKCIHLASGERLQQQCEERLSVESFLDVGEATITDSFSLPCKYIIHTNGPCGEVPIKLASCYKKCMNLLLENNLKTIAFPCISTGKKGYPHANAARIALRTIRYYLRHDLNNKIERVILCLFNEVDISIYLRFMQIYFPV